MGLLCRDIKDNTPEKVIFEQRPKLSEGRNHVVEGGKFYIVGQSGLNLERRVFLGNGEDPLG